MSEPAPPGERRRLLDAVRIRSERRRRKLAEGEPSLARYLGQVGVLGWTIVLPALVGLFIGRWLDHRFGTGVFWSAPLMLLGLALGCWSGWKWMRRS
jgi:ATP synthase protein I